MIEINGKMLCSCCFTRIDSEPCKVCGYDGDREEIFPVLPIGSRINKDRILIGGVLGRGGFGITYAAYDTFRDELIAVKEYYPTDSAYRSIGQMNVSASSESSAETFEAGVEKFFSEADTVRQFNGNPNIVSVYEVFKENNTAYLTMEYLRGLTVLEYVKQNGKLKPGQAINIAAAAAQALQIIHSRNIVHKDISPDNIMLCLRKGNEKQGKIKILDFGAAREVNHSQSVIIAKTGYTPMEQLAGGGKPTEAADIYALGATMYFMVKGEAPMSSQERLTPENNKKYMSSNHGIEPKIWKIIKKATMLKPEDRFKSAEAMLSALKGLEYLSDPIIVTDESITEEPALMIPKEENAADNKDDWQNKKLVHMSKLEEYDERVQKSAKSYKKAIITAAAVLIAGAAIAAAVGLMGNNGAGISTEDTPANTVSETEAPLTAAETEKPVTEAAETEKKPAETLATAPQTVISGSGAVKIINDRAEWDQELPGIIGSSGLEMIKKKAESSIHDDTGCDMLIWINGDKTYPDYDSAFSAVESKLTEKYNEFSSNAGIAVAMFTWDYHNGKDPVNNFIIMFMNGAGEFYDEVATGQIWENADYNAGVNGIMGITTIIDGLADNKK